jgi:Mg-chelatase subunit ChlD
MVFYLIAAIVIILIIVVLFKADSDVDSGSPLNRPAGPSASVKQTAPPKKPAGAASNARQQAPKQSPKKTVSACSRKKPAPSAAVKKHHTDLVGLVGFHDRGFIVAKPAEPHAHWLQERVASFPNRVAGTSTNMTDGLRKGLQLLEKTPRNRYRRIWLLTDGDNNREQDKLMSMVAQAKCLHVNINTIGFGNPGSTEYDPDMLKNISGATHNGRFVPVSSLRELSQALQGGARVGLGNRKAETTVLMIDCSLSMNADMEGKRRIDVVVEALTHLLRYKQQCFS